MKILIWPNPKLKQVSNPVVGTPNPTFLDEMYSTMKMAGGVGLSAIQVGIPERIIVIDAGEGRKVFINPVITKTIGDRIPMVEGCLSVPGQFETIQRFAEVVVTYHDEEMKQHEIHAKGMLAHALQHEIEHLEGILFTDHLKSADRARLMGTIMKLKKQGKLK